jgi:RHS repeat-associated protein
MAQIVSQTIGDGTHGTGDLDMFQISRNDGICFAWTLTPTRSTMGRCQAISFAVSTAKIARYADVAGTQLVVTSSYAYDDQGRLKSLVHAKSTNTLAQYDWTFDAAGRITDFDSLVDGSVTYNYDDTGQVTGADYDYAANSPADSNYAYDANGNRTSVDDDGTISTYNTGDHNRILTDGTYDYLYDAEGNRIKKT